MKQSLSEFIGEKKRLIAAATLSGLGFSALLGCSSGNSPEDTIGGVEAKYKESGLDQSDCHQGTMNGGGVRADLINELERNPDVPNYHNTQNAAIDIAHVLEAMHDIANEQFGIEKSSVVQIGDTYQYCIDKNGRVIAGDPVNFTATTPR